MNDYPAYTFCMSEASQLAKALGHTEIIGIEFGVAGGNGLLAMEAIATDLESRGGPRWRLYGFDGGQGMPKPHDYRDLPYAWRSGWYRMDEAALRARLTRTELWVGLIDAVSLLAIRRSSQSAPIGFIAFDLDYYSSTTTAMTILHYRPNRSLPRTYCYFDDMVGGHDEVHCEWVGEMAAIKEFNAQYITPGNEYFRQLCPINGLATKISPHVEAWTEGVRVLHLFGHQDYCRYVGHGADRQFPLVK